MTIIYLFDIINKTKEWLNTMNDDYTPDLIQLTDDDGKEYNFEVIDAIETDEARYVALIPAEGEEVDDEDEAEFVILKVTDDEEKNESFFEEIEDDEEYETIAEAFMERLKDYFDEIIEEDN